MSESSGLVQHPTDIPCPDWCQRPTGHPLREGAAYPGFHRLHSHQLAELDRWDLALSVELVKLAASPAGPVDQLEAPRAQLDSLDAARLGRDVVQVAASDLRELAAALLAAADTLDALSLDGAR